MSCCAERENQGDVTNEQKWDYINLSDFRSTSGLNPLSYGILYLFLLTSVAVYAVDLFTCANLLFFDRWSGQVKPAIPFSISKWIFTACILLSWVLLVYRWWKAIRAIKTGVVAVSYLDPLAVRVQSIRIGANGRGWRRFLVFAALTKGRKGAEYVALFTYFSFEAWMRILFAEGPRQAINALTLYSVMQVDLVPTGEHSASDGHSPGAQFFVNVQILANKDKEQAIILFGMLFTLIIWIFSALSLALAVLFYIFYLWHHIRDGSLTRYCRRKIDSRLHRIVMVKVNNALAKEYKPRTKQGAKGSRIGPPLGNVKRQPTLPILDTEGNPEFATISRQTTQTSFSPFKSRPSLQNGDTAPNIVARVHSGPNVLSYHQRPEPPSRSTTQSSMRSDASYADDAPLMSSAGSIGYGRPGRGPPARMDSERTLNARPPPPSRVFTSNSQDAQRSYNTSTFRTGPPLLPNSDMSGRMTPHILAPVRQPIPSERSSKAAGQPSGPAEFAPLDQEYEMRSPMHTDRISEQQNNFGYVAFNPNGGGASANSKLSSGLPSARNFTLPDRPANDYFGFIRRPAQRSGTAPLPRGTIFDLALYDSEGKRRQQHDARPMMVPHDRPATAGALWPT